METAAKKIRIVKPGDNVMVSRYLRQTTATMPTTPGSISPPPVPVPDLDRAMIDAYSLNADIVEEYSDDQFKLGTWYVSTLVWNKISKISINLKHAFLCREGMLSGTFARNQFSHLEGNVLTAEKPPTWQSA